MQGPIGGLTRTALLASAVCLLVGDRARGQQAAPSPALLEVRQQLPAALAPSQPAPLEIHVHNRGGAAAENVMVTASLSNAWELLDADPKPERLATGLQWSLGTLEANGSLVVRLRLAPSAAAQTPAELRSDVRVTYQASASVAAVAVVQRPSLALRVTGPDATPPGEAASLLVAVTNSGGAPAEDVTLQTMLPHGLSHPGGNDLETEIGTLRPGETRQVTLTVTPTQAGQFRTRIRALIVGAPAAERETVVSAQEFKVAVEANGPRLLYPEWTGTFEVVLRNDDVRPSQQLAVAVGLPVGLGVVRAGDSGFYDAKVHALFWQLSGLKPGETRTLVWSGVARAVGDQVCQVQVTAGAGARKSLTWRTAVAEAPAERPAAPPSSATPAAPALSTSSRPTAVDGNWHHASATPAGAIAPAALRFAPEEPAAQQAPADRR